MSYLIAQGDALIKTDTGTIQITFNQLEWETEVEEEDRPMGAELCHTGTYRFDGGEVAWMVYEYPIGDVEAVTSQVVGCVIVQDFSEFSVNSFDEGNDYDPTEDPDYLLATYSSDSKSEISEEDLDDMEDF